MVPRGMGYGEFWTTLGCDRVKERLRGGGGEQGSSGEEERVLSGWAVGEQLVGWSKSTCIVVEYHH